MLENWIEKILLCTVNLCNGIEELLAGCKTNQNFLSEHLEGAEKYNQVEET